LWELSKKLGQKESKLSPTVNLMIDKGLIERGTSRNTTRSGSKRPRTQEYPLYLKRDLEIFLNIIRRLISFRNKYSLEIDIINKKYYENIIKGMDAAALEKEIIPKLDRDLAVSKSSKEKCFEEISKFLDSKYCDSIIQKNGFLFTCELLLKFLCDEDIRPFQEKRIENGFATDEEESIIKYYYQKLDSDETKANPLYPRILELEKEINRLNYKNRRLEEQETAILSAIMKKRFPDKKMENEEISNPYLEDM
jgi:hypothetical protein